MALTLRKQPADSVSNPTSASRVSLFVDSVTGNPSTKDSTGAVAPMVTVDGSPLTLNEVTVPGTEANKGKLYAKDVAGGTELFYLDDSGTEVQMTDAGATAGGGGESMSKTGSVFAEGIALTAAGGGSAVIPIPIPAGVNQYFRVRAKVEGMDDGAFGDGGIWTVERIFFRTAAGVLDSSNEAKFDHTPGGSAAMSAELVLTKAPAAELTLGSSASLQHSYSWRYSVGPAQQAPFALS